MTARAPRDQRGPRGGPGDPSLPPPPTPCGSPPPEAGFFEVWEDFNRWDNSLLFSLAQADGIQTVQGVLLHEKEPRPALHPPLPASRPREELGGPSLASPGALFKGERIRL